MPRVGDPAIRRLTARLSVLAAGGTFDAVVLSGKRTTPALAAVGNTPIVADLCDATMIRLRGQAAVADWSERPLLWLKGRVVERSERQVVRAASRLVFASFRDRDALVSADEIGRSSVGTRSS